MVRDFTALDSLMNQLFAALDAPILSWQKGRIEIFEIKVCTRKIKVFPNSKYSVYVIDTDTSGTTLIDPTAYFYIDKVHLPHINVLLNMHPALCQKCASISPLPFNGNLSALVNLNNYTASHFEGKIRKAECSLYSCSDFTNK